MYPLGTFSINACVGRVQPTTPKCTCSMILSARRWRPVCFVCAVVHLYTHTYISIMRVCFVFVLWVCIKVVYTREYTPWMLDRFARGFARSLRTPTHTHTHTNPERESESESEKRDRHSRNQTQRNREMHTGFLSCLLVCLLRAVSRLVVTRLSHGFSSRRKFRAGAPSSNKVAVKGRERQIVWGCNGKSLAVRKFETNIENLKSVIRDRHNDDDDDVAILLRTGRNTTNDDADDDDGVMMAMMMTIIRCGDVFRAQPKLRQKHRVI